MSTDILTATQRSYCMSKIKGRDTKPEVALRKALWHLGYRYKIKSNVRGRPDLVFTSRNVVVFIDGCFWHGCPNHFRVPKTRTAFWLDKINKNITRDQRNNEALRSQGWHIVRIWEHEINDSFDKAVARVVDVLKRGET